MFPVKHVIAVFSISPNSAYHDQMTIDGNAGEIAFVGSYVPRCCGIATFTRDLRRAVRAIRPSASLPVVAVDDGQGLLPYPAEVRQRIDQDDVASYRRAAYWLNRSGVQVVCIQHEFGIYGGDSGSHLLELTDRLEIPVVVTLHTVLAQPDHAQQRVMEALMERGCVIVMSRMGLRILRKIHAVREAEVIPHGIPEMGLPEEDGAVGRASWLLTLGLLGPGKGVEHVLRAMPDVVARHPQVQYHVAGATHPKLLAREGERYRASLERLARDLGIADRVGFENRYLSDDELCERVRQADICLTPYNNEAQATSGALSLAVGAGKPVVSTPYWHAKELLAGGAGVLVPFGDSAAIANAVSGLLDDRARMIRIGREAHAVSRHMVWPEVARKYLRVFDRAAQADRTILLPQIEASVMPPSDPLPPLRVDHLMRMTDGTGLFQHAIFDIPDYHHGYCTDDNARALVLCTMLEHLHDESTREMIDRLATRYLAFLAAAWHESTGRFRNFMNYERRWLEAFGSEDSHGRALWALGVGCGSFSPGRRHLAGQLFVGGLPAMAGFTSPRAWAFALIGMDARLRQGIHDSADQAMCDLLSDRLVSLWHACSGDGWRWFEDHMTYENPRLSQALIRCGVTNRQGAWLDVGLQSLAWLVENHVDREGWFRPVGTNGFHHRDGDRAEFDQQPVEAQAMVSACIDAWQVTGDDAWRQEAERAFGWFLGRNHLGVPLYVEETGGCRDGLHEQRPNENQGAESTLACLISLAELRLADRGSIFGEPVMALQ